jgi:CRISPR-associated endoribonuclease Cas6
MLASIVLHLAPEGKTDDSSRQALPAADRGVLARAVFYEILRRRDAALRDRLHADKGHAPLTAAYLPSRRNNGLRLRFTALTQEVVKILNDSLFHHLSAGARLQMGEENYYVTRIVLDGMDEPLVGLSDYGRLLSLPPKQRLEFRFLTPTTFRMGDANLPLPVPQSVFRGLWQKWNAFAPSALRLSDEVLKFAQGQIFPCRFQLRSATYEMRDGKIIGFLGDCAYELLGKINNDNARAVSALSRYAFFAGIGAKTTMGMGQVMTDWSS